MVERWTEAEWIRQLPVQIRAGNRRRDDSEPSGWQLCADARAEASPKGIRTNSSRRRSASMMRFPSSLACRSVIAPRASKQHRGHRAAAISDDRQHARAVAQACQMRQH